MDDHWCLELTLRGRWACVRRSVDFQWGNEHKLDVGGLIAEAAAARVVEWLADQPGMEKLARRVLAPKQQSFGWDR